MTTEAHGLFLEGPDWPNTSPKASGRTRTTTRPARAIRGAFLAAPIPAEIKQAVSAAHGRLAPPGVQDSPNAAVAVRSSATAEDLPGTHLRRQQDTYLNVVGLAGVLDAVLRCWASLWTSRAIAYRRQAGWNTQRSSRRWVVKRMVLADVAGVLLTANPVTGLRDELVIGASPGPG